MGTVVTAYLVAGAVISTYAIWMAVQNSLLTRRLAELQVLSQEQESDRPAHTRAA